MQSVGPNPSSNESFGTHVADYHYDRWGNRAQQNQTGYSPQLPVDNATNCIAGFSYDRTDDALGLP